jgi:polyhydroxyalkanoate synthesis regulator phasin
MPQMPQAPDWKQVLEAGQQFTELRRSQARTLAADLVAQGHLARDQMSAAIDELIDLSRRRTDQLRKVVQKEVQRQLSTIGVATKKDLDALERRVAKQLRETKKAAGAAKAAKKSAAKSAKTARKAG